MHHIINKSLPSSLIDMKRTLQPVRQEGYAAFWRESVRSPLLKHVMLLEALERRQPIQKHVSC